MSTVPWQTTIQTPELGDTGRMYPFAFHFIVRFNNDPVENHYGVTIDLLNESLKQYGLKIVTIKPE